MRLELTLIGGALLSGLILVIVGHKWEIDARVTLPAACVIGLVSGLCVSGLVRAYPLRWWYIVGLEVGLSITCALALLLWRFYRDPERQPPDDDRMILSPADGQVIYIKEIEEGQIPLAKKHGRTFSLSEFVKADVLPQGGYLIGIAMNYLDVHVNRAPIGGRISLLKHINGLFLSLKHREAILQNERVLTVIDNGRFKVGIVQIASRLVRKIVTYFQEGQEIQGGARIGVIR
ncbi:MAG: phosphatidylserine decarboxylase, partial [Candidatus Tectomicrobia bacterium]|nr:phosphatidylserine decarboxylase [Candidatus Tectomicrobia bacterium]